MIDAARSAWSSSPRRTFVVLPLAAAAFELSRRRWPLRGGIIGLALMAAGFALYRGTGAYRGARGGGGPGFSAEPVALVTDGPYALSRNPMYLGHLIFLAGLVALTRSPLALAGFCVQRQRFIERVAIDERRLADRFGQAYVEYVEKVPRWIPRISRRSGCVWSSSGSSRASISRMRRLTAGTSLPGWAGSSRPHCGMARGSSPALALSNASSRALPSRVARVRDGAQRPW